MRTNLTPECHCLNCGTAVSAATGTQDEDNIPKPGDISLCFYCGHLMALADDLTVREANDEELRAIAGDPHLLELQAAIKKYWAVWAESHRKQ